MDLCTISSAVSSSVPFRKIDGEIVALSGVEERKMGDRARGDGSSMERNTAEAANRWMWSYWERRKRRNRDEQAERTEQRRSYRVRG